MHACLLLPCYQADTFASMNVLLHMLCPAKAGAKRTSDIKGVPRLVVLGYRCGCGNTSQVPCECW